MKKVVIFDAYGTLFDVNAAARNYSKETADINFINTWEKVSKLWRDKQIAYTWYYTSIGYKTNFWKVTEDSLDKSMKVFNINPDMRTELLDLYKILSPYPEVKETLKLLREKNYKLSILSNGTPSLLDELVNRNNLNDIFDDIMSVEEVGIFKPSSKVYDMPIKKYNIKEKEVAFLSSNTWDVSGGGNYGFNAIWVNRNNATFDNLDYTPKNEINNLKQLLDIV